MAYAKDLTNQRFGRLLVISRNLDKQKELYDLKGIYKAYWNCRCDCGKMTVVNSSCLMNKTNPTLSCGCLAKEKQHSQKNIKENCWIFNGKTAIGKDSKGNLFYIDAEDYDIVKGYCWRVNNNGYVVANIRNGSNKTIFLHRVIMKLSDDKLFVDHKNWNKSDNRKENLRIATKSQNNINIKRKKNNTTGYPGISKNRNNNYVVRISMDKKRYYMGTYKTFEEAVRVRREAELTLHKDWSGENNKHEYEKIIKSKELEN